MRNNKSIMNPEICKEIKPLRDKGVIWRTIIKAYPGLKRTTVINYYSLWKRGLISKPKPKIRQSFTTNERYNFLQQQWIGGE